MLGVGYVQDVKREDAMIKGVSGDNCSVPLGYFSQSFLTFRGVKMGEKKCLDAYVKKVG